MDSIHIRGHARDRCHPPSSVARPGDSVRVPVPCCRFARLTGPEAAPWGGVVQKQGRWSELRTRLPQGEPVTPAPLAARLSVPSGPLFFPRHRLRPRRRPRPRRLPHARARRGRGRSRRGLRLLRHRRVPRAHPRGVRDVRAGRGRGDGGPGAGRRRHGLRHRAGRAVRAARRGGRLRQPRAGPVRRGQGRRGVLQLGPERGPALRRRREPEEGRRRREPRHRARAPGSWTCTTVQYKSGTRKHIEDDLGYEIIANFGDQYSDLDGGYADRTYKLPNPTYFVS